MTDPNLFDAVRGEKLKDAGQEKAAANRKVILEQAQDEAYRLALRHGTVTVDDVMHQIVEVYGWNAWELGPAAGSIFKGPMWEFTGQWVKSRRTSNHSRYIRQWKLRAK